MLAGALEAADCSVAGAASTAGAATASAGGGDASAGAGVAGGGGVASTGAGGGVAGTAALSAGAGGGVTAFDCARRLPKETTAKAAMVKIRTIERAGCRNIHPSNCYLGILIVEMDLLIKADPSPLMLLSAPASKAFRWKDHKLDWPSDRCVEIYLCGFLLGSRRN